MRASRLGCLILLILITAATALGSSVVRTAEPTQRIAPVGVALATRYPPADLYVQRNFVNAGGSMAYAPDHADTSRRSADCVGKILGIAKPGDLPVEEPTQYRLIVNLTTATALGITILDSTLPRADEVIR